LNSYYAWFGIPTLWFSKGFTGIMYFYGFIRCKRKLAIILKLGSQALISIIKHRQFHQRMIWNGDISTSFGKRFKSSSGISIFLNHLIYHSGNQHLLNVYFYRILCLKWRF
jgi:hypothetical protein